MEGKPARAGARISHTARALTGAAFALGLLVAQPLVGPGATAASAGSTTAAPLVITGDITVSPSTLRFGTREAATTSESKTVHVTNTGAGTLTFQGIVIKEGDSGDFVITKNGCKQTLDPGLTCGVEVAFRPSSGTFGPRSSTLEISSDVTPSPLSVSLIGEVGTPDVDVEPSDLTFAPQLPGTTSPSQSVSVHNGGNAELQISDLKLDPTDDFNVVSGDCFQGVKPGGSCNIEIVFSPKTASGDVKLDRSAILTITDNDPSSPSQLVAVDGTVPTPLAEVSPTSLDFGAHSAGTPSAPQTVTLRNPGTGTLTISALEMKGLDPDDFNVAANDCPGALAPGQSCRLTIVFQPQKADGALSALLTITDDSPTATHTVALHGRALPGKGAGAAPTPGGGGAPAIGAIRIAGGTDAGAAAPVAPSAAVAPATTPAVDAMADAAPDTATEGATPQSIVERPVTGERHGTLAPAVEEHNALVSALLAAVSNDGILLRGLLTGLLMSLPLGLLAAAAWAVRLRWKRRRAQDGPSES